MSLSRAISHRVRLCDNLIIVLFACQSSPGSNSQIKDCLYIVKVFSGLPFFCQLCSWIRFDVTLLYMPTKDRGLVLVLNLLLLFSTPRQDSGCFLSCDFP